MTADEVYHAVSDERVWPDYGGIGWANGGALLDYRRWHKSKGNIYLSHINVYVRNRLIGGRLTIGIGDRRFCMMTIINNSEFCDFYWGDKIPTAADLIELKFVLGDDFYDG